MLFNGAGVAENFDVSANGTRVRFFRDVATITMDLDDTEQIDVQALGGVDNAVVNDITGTDLKLVAFDLEATIGGGAGDGAADSVTVNGTAGPTRSTSRPTGGVVDVDGSPAEVTIDHSEAANDKLTVNGLGRCRHDHGRPGPRSPDPARHQRRDRGRRSSPAATAPTGSSASSRTTRCSAAPATTPSCGTPATATTSSRARRGQTTRWSSTARPERRSSKPRPSAGGSASPATSATSSWTSTTRRRSTSTRSAVLTWPPSTT